MSAPAEMPVTAAPVSDVPVPVPTPMQAELEAKLGRAVDPVVFARAARKRLAKEPLTPEEEHELRDVTITVTLGDPQPEPQSASSLHARPGSRFYELHGSRLLTAYERGLRGVPPSDPLEYKRIADARVKRREKAAKRAEQLARLAKAGSRARARALPRPAEDPAPAIEPSPSAEDPCSQP